LCSRDEKEDEFGNLSEDGSPGFITGSGIERTRSLPNISGRASSCAAEMSIGRMNGLLSMILVFLFQFISAVYFEK